jgi:SpoVK/Ycf46/Vps4 family AAA+-type ATPase
MSSDLAFRPGDIVKFVGVEDIGDSVPEFQTSGVAPSAEFWLQGKTVVGARYFDNWGIVTWAGNGYYVVQYDDLDNKEVRLAFAKTRLQLVRNEGDKNKIDFTKLDRIVISDETKEEIIAVLKQHKNVDKLFEEWGLGEVMEYGRGMTMMFYGPPGTGKTGMARAIAESLQTGLEVISAAEIQSSEPGGANRNIQDAFKNAKAKKSILFLDECDSLITSRADLGMILASEVNTLLTEIEKFEGVCILATNRIENMDEALERRISLIVEFPRPNEAQRLNIWKTMLPAKMPMCKKVKVEDLAKHDYSGGEIKNVILSAARLAVSTESDKVEQVHFDKAMARIAKSQGLMGTKSRYDQRGGRQDLGVGVGKGNLTVDRGISTFLQKEADKAREKFKDEETTN